MRLVAGSITGRVPTSWSDALVREWFYGWAFLANLPGLKYLRVQIMLLDDDNILDFWYNYEREIFKDGVGIVTAPDVLELVLPYQAAGFMTGYCDRRAKSSLILD
jgi:hypothetical protein